jgi:hypothetical protein
MKWTFSSLGYSVFHDRDFEGRCRTGDAGQTKLPHVIKRRREIQATGV